MRAVFGRITVVFLISVYASVCTYSAQAQDFFLEDKNGDGLVSALAFGDSLTFGVGDGFPAGAYVPVVMTADPGGYPPRVSSLLGVPVTNSGVPGEMFLSEGIDRFPEAVRSSTADIISILEGVNDAISVFDSSEYQSMLQKAVNVARALSRNVLLMTNPPPCCNHGSLAPFVQSFNAAVREVARRNSLPLADIARAWSSTCQNRSMCELFNVPEGLHPNTRGYRVIAEVYSAALLGIDIFTFDGQQELEDALGFEPGSLVTLPDEIVE